MVENEKDSDFSKTSLAQKQLPNQQDCAEATHIETIDTSKVKKRNRLQMESSYPSDYLSSEDIATTTEDDILSLLSYRKGF